MSAEVINLRQARKARQRAARQRQAETNREKHGRSKIDRDRAAREAQARTRHLDGHWLEPPQPADDDARDPERDKP